LRRQKVAQSEKTLYDLVLEIFGKVEVVRSQQTEINRRVGIIEKRLNAERTLSDRVSVLEASVASVKEDVAEDDGTKDQWWNWFWQAVVWAAGITVAAVVASYFGIEVKA
jgi:hypothetical protein